MRTIFAALVLATAMGVLSSSATVAQSTSAGPVGKQCEADITKFCKDVQHGSMDARACLEANRGKVSAACRRALDSTGGGRGSGRNRQL